MVLTNFECWAHGESPAVNFEIEPSPARHSPVVDPFNARVVSHIASASNGYYGYAIVNNAAAASDNNNNSCNNNNVQPMQMQVSDVGVAADTNNDAAAAARCKKRCFTMGHEKLDMEMDNLTAVKRCRFDDADLVAQYCNDFFSLPATQMIGTQACLMDYDYDVQQQQQQPQQQQQQQQQQTQQQLQHPRIHQHYQGHLHRANRDTAHNKNSSSDNKNYAIP
ncbi:protein kinase 4 isoform X2 [Drosophila virilis]|uniref:Uncharacterized protein n=1 Tax=Drosophila virilis TaxID=7244 RepID=B4LGC4_DROVI|nr:probable basic-leucine zipper transcription factor D isoform X2 [Drosophila virilis]EDW70453.2 uncharacterized protein Dvir_GJ13782 [Drosophila virilis]